MSIIMEQAEIIFYITFVFWLLNFILYLYTTDWPFQDVSDLIDSY